MGATAGKGYRRLHAFNASEKQRLLKTVSYDLNTYRHLQWPSRPVVKGVFAVRCWFMLMECGHWASVRSRLLHTRPTTWRCWKCKEGVAPSLKGLLQARLCAKEKSQWAT